ncbi:hypothetical protein FHU34_111731 [Micromonospora taraxaci]|uniref:Uncharacterized protein n=1 Tax=Micromonospora taraxaci TaxID=1316803 RepID=A0A561VXQ7_9ACTN|nr:hypothetical protein FHU34_111731 [Micromonospora taraxaci]
MAGWTLPADGGLRRARRRRRGPRLYAAVAAGWARHLGRRRPQAAVLPEYDLGTERPLSRLVDKIDGYRELAHATGRIWPVLFWLHSPERERHLHQELAATGTIYPEATACTPRSPASPRPRRCGCCTATTGRRCVWPTSRRPSHPNPARRNHPHVRQAHPHQRTEVTRPNAIDRYHTAFENSTMDDATAGPRIRELRQRLAQLQARHTELDAGLTSQPAPPSPASATTSAPS